MINEPLLFQIEQEIQRLETASLDVDAIDDGSGDGDGDGSDVDLLDLLMSPDLASRLEVLERAQTTLDACWDALTADLLALLRGHYERCGGQPGHLACHQATRCLVVGAVGCVCFGCGFTGETA